MTRPTEIEDTCRPSLAEHVRWREDKARDQMVLMAPERLYVPDEIACDVLQRFDGETSFAEVVGQLAADYNAPEETIAHDIRDMLRDLIDKGLVAL